MSLKKPRLAKSGFVIRNTRSVQSTKPAGFEAHRRPLAAPAAEIWFDLPQADQTPSRCPLMKPTKSACSAVPARGMFAGAMSRRHIDQQDCTHVAGRDENYPGEYTILGVPCLFPCSKGGSKHIGDVKPGYPLIAIGMEYTQMRPVMQFHDGSIYLYSGFDIAYDLYFWFDPFSANKNFRIFVRWNNTVGYVKATQSMLDTTYWISYNPRWNNYHLFQAGGWWGYDFGIEGTLNGLTGDIR